MKLSLIVLLFIFFFFSSCTTEKSITNNRNKPVLKINNYLSTGRDNSGKIVTKMPEPIIEKNDLLHIRVFSQSVVPETDIPYNLNDGGTPVSGSSGGSSTSGFLVDNNGNIEYPRIGTLHVEGLTKEAVANVIKDKLSSALKNPSVIVRFLNYKVTVLGEVKNPTTISSSTDRITILEALGMAGDVTEFGDRSNIKVAREINGEIQYGEVDLTQTGFFTSPYFRLKQNDVVFVQPTERKRMQDEREFIQEERKLKQEDRQAVAQQIGIVTGIITSIALILNFIK
jgi:polysaccharide export outer membrane protein